MVKKHECKYGCGFIRSRKARVVEHEKTCKHRIIERLEERLAQVEEDNKNMKNDLYHYNLIVKDLQKLTIALQSKCASLIKREKKKEVLDDLYDFDFLRDFGYLDKDRKLLDYVWKKADKKSDVFELFVTCFFSWCPQFCVVNRSAQKMRVKGVIGRNGNMSVGSPGVVSTMSFNDFYKAIIPEFISLLREYYTDQLYSTDVKEDEIAAMVERHLVMSSYELPKAAGLKSNEYNEVRSRHLACKRAMISKIHAIILERQFSKVNTCKPEYFI